MDLNSISVGHTKRREDSAQVNGEVNDDCRQRLAVSADVNVGDGSNGSANDGGLHDGTDGGVNGEKRSGLHRGKGGESESSVAEEGGEGRHR